MSDTTTLTLTDVHELTKSVLTKAGMDDHGGDVLAELVMLSERDGPRSHGLRMVPFYVQSFRSDYANPQATPKITRPSAGVLRGDGDNGYYQIARKAAEPQLIANAREHGIAAFTCANCHHLGAMRFDTEPFAQAGLVAIGVANSLSMIAPHGGERPVFGTNPMSFAAPRPDREPIVWDQASSMIALMDIKMAATEGHTLPRAAGLDPSGAPTTDPNAILETKTLLPFGDHKGTAIALMVEIMGAALAGGTLAVDNAEREAKGGLNVKGGVTLIAMDPAKFGNAAFGDYVTRICAEIDGNGTARVPGDGRILRRAMAERDGVIVANDLLETLTNLAG